MKFKFGTLMAVVGIAALSTAAFAQGGRGGGAGGGQGMPRMMGGMMGNPVQLVMNESVQRELALTDAQKKQLSDKFPNVGGPGGGFGGGAGGGGGRGAGGGGGAGGGMTAEQRAAQREQQEKDLQAILTPAQYTRLTEISLQQQGPAAILTNDKVAKELGVTDDQKSKMQDIQRQAGEQMRENMQNLQGASREEMMEAMNRFRTQVNDRMLAVLTADQKAKWTAMLGKPFTIQMGRGG